MEKIVSACLMGIDFGTSGVRVAIIDSYGMVLAQKEEMYKTFYPKVGWAEQKPADWWNAFSIALKECLSHLDSKQKKEIIACCVCATSSTALPVDEGGNPLGDAILWMDSRAVDEVNLINATKHPVLQYCGGDVSVEWLIPKALWLKKNKQELYNSSYKLIEQLDWINYKISGKWVSSICNATCKWNYVDFENGWNDSFFKEIGLDDYQSKLLLDVRKVGEPIGMISSDFAKEFGLSENMTLIQGGIDAHIGMIGLGVTKPNVTGIIMGTSFVHLSLVKEPIFQKGIWGPYHNAVIPDFWLLEGGQVSAGSLVRWFKEVFDIKHENPYDLMSDEASKIPAGAEGLVVLDCFQGNRTPYKNPNAKGVFYGLQLKHTRAHIFRAILESVAFGTKNILDNFERQGCKIDSLVVCGGVTKDPLWLQIIADVTGRPIIITKNLQAGTLGCCITAAVGMKLFSDFDSATASMVYESYRVNPDKEMHTQYLHPYESYLNIYRSLHDIMK